MLELLDEEPVAGTYVVCKEADPTAEPMFFRYSGPVPPPAEVLREALLAYCDERVYRDCVICFQLSVRKGKEVYEAHYHARFGARNVRATPCGLPVPEPEPLPEPELDGQIYDYQIFW